MPSAGFLRAATGVAVLAASIVVASISPTASHAATLAEKRAEAARVTAQVDKLDDSYGILQERFRGAQIKLGSIDEEIATLDTELAQATRDLDVAEQRLLARVLVIYREGSANTEIVNLARAGSFDKLFTRLQAIRMVSRKDRQILDDITVLRRKVEVAKDAAAEARVEQARVVKQRRAAKTAMAKKLAKRKAVLGSVNAEIRSMVAAEQARQAAAAAAAARASAATVTAPTATSSSTVGTTPSPSVDAGTALSPPVTSLPPASGAAASAAGIAMGYIGVPYRFGGASPGGFDCSGLIMYAFGQAGISLPHSSYALWGAGPHVSRSQLQTGDLVFFEGLGHAGIYVGGGSFVHSPRTGQSVRVDSLSGYWNGSYVGAVRVG